MTSKEFSTRDLEAVSRMGSLPACELAAEVIRLRRLFESLTPGGSEFYDDPDRCARNVLERRQGLEDSWRRLIREKNDLVLRVKGGVR